MSEKININELEGEVIELCVRLVDDQNEIVGHVTVSGRVRLVATSPAVWVGKCCLPWNQAVSLDRGDNKDAYVCNAGEIADVE